MIYTHDEITVPFIAAQRQSSDHEQFTPDQEVELLVAACLHDLGECCDEDVRENVGFVLGDPEYGTAPVDHKTKEKLIRNYLFDKYFGDLPPELLKRVDQIDLKETSDVCVEAFEVIERLGYFTLSRRAGDIVIREKGSAELPDLRIAQLGRLATVVGNYHYAYLRSKQEKFAHLEPTLDKLMSPTVVV